MGEQSNLPPANMLPLGSESELTATPEVLPVTPLSPLEPMAAIPPMVPMPTMTPMAPMPPMAPTPPLASLPPLAAIGASGAIGGSGQSQGDVPGKAFTQYQHSPTRYDEMLAADRVPRPHWQMMLKQLAKEAPEKMQHRLHLVQRQVKENGVTYNVYADPKGSSRPWNLDLIPLILPQEEWRQIEAAVIQRAGLMNNILRDIYGSQNLISEGYLPAKLVYGNAGYLRPCHGILQGQQVALHTYAVDLARGPDGKWLVVGDRTQAPSGAAYALENRNTIARAFPDLFREHKVQDLTQYFSALRDSLDHWGRQAAAFGMGSTPLRDSEQPLMVLLTPGPYNETYSEQSYLARYLGFALVEGSDLTVRNGMVWMKTLSGLQRVHVILRRLDDDFCDPLELRADSCIGIVGLTEAARRGNVVIANGLGTNILESGALLGFLPRMCQRLMGEPLKMQSVGTWWCGESTALDYAISNLANMVIKPSVPQLRNAPVFGADLSAPERDTLIAKMRANPQNFVAQNLVHLSQAPRWDVKRDVLTEAAIGLRVFACGTPNGYMVMPGGLARVAPNKDGRIINMQHGGASKDTWVVGGGVKTQRHFMHHATTVADLSRGDAHLASRVVDNFFWFGRYAERCEHLVRLVRIALDMRLQFANELRGGGEWSAILALCQRFGLLDAIEVAHPPIALSLASPPDPDDAIEVQLINSIVNPQVPGLAANLRGLFNVAFHLRERLSLDNWRKLNQLVQQVEAASDTHSLLDAQVLLEDSAMSLFTLSGFALDGMTRDEGWRFLSIGRWVERVQFVGNNLAHALQMPAGCRLDWLLELADSIVTYRSRYMATPEWLPTLDMLLLDETNPRSVIFQLNGLEKYLSKLEKSSGECGINIIRNLLQRLANLQLEQDLKRESSVLAQLLHDINAGCDELVQIIQLRFFTNTDLDAENNAAQQNSTNLTM